MKTLYQTSATVTGGRNRKVTRDGALELEVRMPKELGGSQTGYTKPEQLFAAGYASCFDSALNLVMGQQKVKPGSPSSVKTSVALLPDGKGGFKLDVTLEVNLPQSQTFGVVVVITLLTPLGTVPFHPGGTMANLPGFLPVVLLPI